LTRLEAVSARQDEATPDPSAACRRKELAGQFVQVIERKNKHPKVDLACDRPVRGCRRAGGGMANLVLSKEGNRDMFGASSIHKARDLSPDLRRAAEALLGRNLQEDESISVRAFKGDTVKEAPTGEVRAEAFRRLRARIEQTAARAPGVPEADIDALIDEAVDHVRHHRG